MEKVLRFYSTNFVLDFSTNFFERLLLGLGEWQSLGDGVTLRDEGSFLLLRQAEVTGCTLL